MGFLAGIGSGMALLFTLILGFANPVAATTTGSNQICGLYQVEEFGHGIIHSIVVWQSPRYLYAYTLKNPEATQRAGLWPGLCYCVQGQVSVNPSSEGDRYFMRLQVEKVTSMAYRGCVPYR